jgi:signal transduction histidine kinase
MLGGLYWRRGNRTGALAGIGAGFLLWGYTQLSPIFAEAGLLAAGLVDHGPWGLDWLRPRSLFGLAGLDPLTHAVFWSLGANCVCYVIGSLVTRASAIEQRQAPVFVAAVAHAPYPAVPFEGQTPVADLVGLAETYLGGDRVLEAFRQHLDLPALASTDAALHTPADLDALRFTERLIAGAIGAASARVVVAGSLQKKLLSRTEAMAVLDEASQAIHFNRTLLRATLENINQGICVLDSTLHLAAWNRRFLELADLPTSLVKVGTSLAEIVAFNEARGEYGSGGEMATLLQRIEQASGPEIYERTRPDRTVLEIATNPMPDGGIVATFANVTERHNAAAALRKANESLERRVAERTTALALATADAQRANLSKTRFLAAASHDLLQPLHAARLFTTALAEQRYEPPAGSIDASLRSVETLLRALLDVSKLDGGAVTAQPIAFRIDALLTTLAREFTAIALERGIELRLLHSTAGVRSDPALLRRIVQNFLSNALRYTESGRVLVGCRSRVQTCASRFGTPDPASRKSTSAIFLWSFSVSPPGAARPSVGLGSVLRLPTASPGCSATRSACVHSLGAAAAFG